MTFHDALDPVLFMLNFTLETKLMDVENEFWLDFDETQNPKRIDSLFLSGFFDIEFLWCMVFK